jgi:3-hydroxyisobutyrate dehydrogenase
MITLLGTGRMGSAIAQRLASAGIEMTLWNRTRDRATSLGIGRVVDTPAEAAAAADIVISSLTGPEALRSVYLDAGGALEATNKPLFIDMSTAGPDAIAALEPRVTATGSRMIDVPILGGPTFVMAGQATLLAGGDEADIERARPVLERLGTVRHVGAIGSAARLKLIANSMLGLVAAGAAELQAGGESVGLAPEEVFWVLTRVVPNLEARHDGYVGSGQHPTLFALRDLRKDLALAGAMLGPEASILSLSARTRQLVEDAARDVPDEDISALVRRYRRASQPAASTEAAR